MVADLRVALRALRRAPSFAVACILSLSLGVGLNGTVFAVIDAAMLRPPPYHRPDRLLTLQDNLQVPDNYLLSFDEYSGLRASAKSFIVVGAFRAGMGNRYALQLDPDVAKTSGMAVTASAFSGLHIAPLAGRLFQADDERAGAPPVVIIGSGLWHRVFGGTSSAIGSTIRVDGRPHTIIGVMPEGFWFPTWSQEFWTALSPEANHFARTERSLSVIARLRDGVPTQTGAAELEQFGRRLDGPGNPRERRWWRVMTFADAVHPGDARQVLALQVVAAAVLLLACINVSNLMLVRLILRRRDTVIRSALGASRWLVIRPFLAESAWLAVAVAIVSGAFSFGALRLIVATFDRAMLGEMILGGGTHIVLFSLAGALLAILLCVTGPLVQTVRGTAFPAIREGGGASGFGRMTQRMRRGAVALQIAFSLALCSSSTMLVGALRDATRWNPGFPAEGLLVVPARALTDGTAAAVSGALVMDRLKMVPGVAHVAFSRSMIVPEGRIISDAQTETSDCSCQAVSADIVATLGVQLRQGRTFAASDIHGEPVATIDERLARRLWPSTTAIGRRLKMGERGPWITVIGEFARTDFSRPSADRMVPPQPGMFVLTSPDSLTRGSIFVRSEHGTSAALAVQSTLATITSDRAARSLMPMTRILDATLTPLRTYRQLFGLLAVLALTLSITGLHGVLGYHVISSSREYGIRAALGASPGSLFRLVVTDASWLLTGGILLGSLLAIMTGRLVSSVLLSENRSVMIPLALSAAVLLVACMGTVFGPALRAGRASPIEAIREQV